MSRFSMDPVILSEGEKNTPSSREINLWYPIVYVLPEFGSDISVILATMCGLL